MGTFGEAVTHTPQTTVALAHAGARGQAAFPPPQAAKRKIRRFLVTHKELKRVTQRAAIP